MRKKLELRFKEALFLLKLIAAFVVTRFRKKKELWLISERGHEARDNAYFFFLYMKKNHPQVNTKYIISKDSPDLNRLKPYINDVIWVNSFSHYLYFWKATHLISTHVMGYAPFREFCHAHIKGNKILKAKRKIFLQHGIIKDYIPELMNGKICVDLFVCGARLEYDYVKEHYGFPDGIVKYIGLCRYDNLNDFTSKRQVLIMPTWRQYIDKNYFEESEYYQQYKNLLTSSELHRILKQSHYTAIFYPHYEVQSNIQSFKKLILPKEIKIAGFEYDVQDLLKSSSMLITDYSSVYFDMAYMQKNVLFFQFDQTLFQTRHYQKGYIMEDYLGHVTTNISELLFQLSELLANDCTVEEKYLHYMDKLFTLRDSDNCLRTYHTIKSLG